MLCRAKDSANTFPCAAQGAAVSIDLQQSPEQPTRARGRRWVPLCQGKRRHCSSVGHRHTRARPCAIRPAEPFLSCLPAGTLLLAAVPLGSPWGWKGARRCSRGQEMTQGCSEQAGKAWCNSTANGQAGSGCLTLAKCSAPSWQASPNLSPGSCRRGCCARRARLAARGVGSRARGQMGRL